MKQSKIIIGADFAPIEKDGEFLLSHDTAELIDSKLIEKINQADFSVFNLESPIIRTGTPIEKDGPCLFIPQGADKVYKDIHVGLLSLANNHIMDYGKEGLFHTLDILKEKKIPFIGAGKNEKEADSCYIVELQGKKIGIYAAADHEFSLAYGENPGANGYEENKVMTKIQNIKKQADYCIVLYHGGKEWYRYPSPWQQKFCRKMADAGADAVICQHSHCIGASEKYKDCTIFYGQGNFVLGEADHEICVYSMLLEFSVGDTLEWKAIPMKRLKEKVIQPSKEESIRVLRHFEKLNVNLQKKGFVEDNYRKYAEETVAAYLYQFAGWPLIFIRLDKLFHRKGIKWFFKRNKKRILYLQNVLQCEAHREVVLEGLKTLR